MQKAPCKCALKGLGGALLPRKPQVFQEWLQPSAKTAGSYTSGAFKAGSLFILTNFCGLVCDFRHVDSWLWLSKSAGFGTRVPQVNNWFFFAEFQPPRSHDSALLPRHGFHSGGGKTTRTVMKLQNRACVHQSKLWLTWRANISKFFCRTPLITPVKPLLPNVTVFQNNSSAKHAVATLVIFFYVNPQRLRARSLPKYPARTFSTFTSWLVWMRRLPVWKTWWLILPPAS